MSGVSRNVDVGVALNDIDRGDWFVLDSIGGAEDRGRDRAADVDVEAAVVSLAVDCANPAIPGTTPQTSAPRWRMRDRRDAGRVPPQDADSVTAMRNVATGGHIMFARSLCQHRMRSFGQFFQR